MLKKVLIPILLIIGVIVGALSLIKNFAEHDHDHSGVKIEVGNQLPDFTLYQFGGGEFPHSKLGAKVTLINFWATWCDACVVEMPSILKLRSKFRDQGFEVVFISLDENPSSVLPDVLTQMKINFSTYIDPKQDLATLFNVRGIPLSVVLDEKREILAIVNGERDWNASQVHESMKTWLSRP